MLRKCNVAVMGAGNIAGMMADTLRRMSGARCYAIGSRSIEKARGFAEKYGCKKAYGSYEELVTDKDVDLVYIATPHSEHYANARLCIDHGKPVLCEKAFTPNASQARELFAYAEEKRVFITEAMWTRYMPMLKTIREVLDSDVIGSPKMLTANLGYVIDKVPRLREPELAGGALLDVGVYTINFASMIFGDEIDKITAVCTYTDTGVDEQDSITLTYKDGRMAVLNSSMLAVSDRKGIIHGTKGYAVVENINNFEQMEVFDLSHKKIASYKRPKQITGYEYEVEACMRALKEGWLGCPEMPHAESVSMLEIMDRVRAMWNVSYPFE